MNLMPLIYNFFLPAREKLLRFLYNFLLRFLYFLTFLYSEDSCDTVWRVKIFPPIYDTRLNLIPAKRLNFFEDSLYPSLKSGTGRYNSHFVYTVEANISLQTNYHTTW